MQNKINHIFFDLDHTLWDFEKNSALAFQIVFQKNQININLDDFLKNYIPINHLYWEKFRKDEVTKEELRLGRLRDSFRFFDVRYEDGFLDILAEDYIEFLPQSNHLFEGAIEILEYLKGKYKLHIITNGFAGVQEHKINNANIGHYFQSVTNSESAGVKKPNPVIFDYALQLANAQKSESIMIGDCIDADVRGAIRYGIDAILFDESNQYHNETSIKKVNHLLQLKNYL